MSKVKVFSSDLGIRRLQYQEVLISKGYSYAEVAEMEMKELRAAVDESMPLTITQCSNTVRGGKTKKVTIVRVA
jgi:hypothetical protein